MNLMQTAPDVSSDDLRLRQVFAAQKAAFARNAYPSYGDRQANLSALNTAIAQNKDAIIEALDQDFGCRSYTETVVAEILGSHGAIR